MHQQGKINREDMLELTRRMTLSRNCFSRIAGAYFDEEGCIDGTFNRHFRKLTAAEQKANLEIAKAIPFSRPLKTAAGIVTALRYSGMAATFRNSFLRCEIGSHSRKTSCATSSASLVFFI